jgi:hypothetical protein
MTGVPRSTTPTRWPPDCSRARHTTPATRCAK